MRVLVYLRIDLVVGPGYGRGRCYRAAYQSNSAAYHSADASGEAFERRAVYRERQGSGCLSGRSQSSYDGRSYRVGFVSLVYRFAVSEVIQIFVGVVRNFGRSVRNQPISEVRVQLLAAFELESD